MATVSTAQRRLRKRREFLAVQNGGRRVGGRHFLFFVRPRPAEASALAAETRFGITVTRKIGNAVTRNRVKRVVREGFRQIASTFPAGLDLVVVARASAPEAATADVAAELRELARRLGARSGR